MNNITRKRRAYGPGEDLAEQELPVLSHHPSSGLGIQSLTPDPHHILRQAPSTSVNITISLDKLLDFTPESYKEILEITASNINVPAHLLSQLSRFNNYPNYYNQPQPPPQLSHHEEYITPKRPRLDPSVPMSAPYSDDTVGRDGHEKQPLAGQPGHDGNTTHKPLRTFTDSGSSSGWTRSRLAECLAAFPMCPPYTTYDSEPAYQRIPTSGPYSYGDSRPALGNGVVSLQPQSHLPPNPGALDSGQVDMFSCDDPAMVSQYLPDYPAMRPTPASAMHPPLSREGMVYSSGSPVGRYGNEPFRGVSGLEVQGQMSSLGPPNPLSATYSPEIASPAFTQFNGFAPLPASLNPPEGYVIKVEQDNLDHYGQPAPFDLFEHQKAVPAKRGPFKDNDKRLATARTRKKGSCIRCRMQRIRCVEDEQNETGPCIPCKKIVTNTRIYRLNCLRWKITDVKLFKPGQVKGLEWTLRWKDSVVSDIGSWASTESRMIQVTEGYTGKSVRLQVRQFQPQKGDRLERSWYSNGQKKTKEIPAFAIVDMDAAKKSFDDYIKQGLFDCCKRVLGPQEMLLWQTYAIALKTMRDPSTNEVDKKLLTNTLDLWMSVRLTTKSFEIVGEETLGMNHQDFDDDTNPLRGKIPLPPVMGAQIDSILIHQVQPLLRRNTLEELQKMTQEKKQKTWLITYLVTFILLHNIALITRHDAEYAKKHGMKGRWARECNVKEYNLGANTLLAYFHYCNKGIYPFSTECRDQDVQSLAELDDEAMTFVRYTRRYASQQKRDWEKLWQEDAYENEYYYVSQLFEHNWQPRTMI